MEDENFLEDKKAFSLKKPMTSDEVPSYDLVISKYHEFMSDNVRLIRRDLRSLIVVVKRCHLTHHICLRLTNNVESKSNCKQWTINLLRNLNWLYIHFEFVSQSHSSVNPHNY